MLLHHSTQHMACLAHEHMRGSAPTTFVLSEAFYQEQASVCKTISHTEHGKLLNPETAHRQPIKVAQPTGRQQESNLLDLRKPGNFIATTGREADLGKDVQHDEKGGGGGLAHLLWG